MRCTNEILDNAKVRPNSITPGIHRMLRLSASLMLFVVFLAFLGNLSAQEIASSEKDPAAMWITEDIPKSAVARYGEEGRNPSAVGIHGLRYSHDGKLLAARDKRQNIRILDLEKQELRAVLQTQSKNYDFTFCPGDKFIACGKRTETQIWDIEKSELVRVIKQTGRSLATTTNPDQLIIVGRGDVNRYSWPLPSKPAYVKTKLSGHTILARGVSHDGDIAVFHNGRTIELLNTVTGKPILPTPESIPQGAIFSPNSNLLAELNGDRQLNLFDLSNAAKYHFVLHDKSKVVTAAFSCDSRFLYTSHYDESIVIWDLVTMKAIARVSGHKNEIFALAAHPHRSLTLASGASGSVDRTIIFWDFHDRLFPPIEDLSDFDFDLVWYDLASENPKVSLSVTNMLYRALQSDKSLYAELSEKLGLETARDDSLARALINDLDHRKYLFRERATLRLKSMVEQIRPLLERELREGSQEAKWRIMKILAVDREKPAILTKEGRRKLRVLQALELCGDSDAKKLLSRIASSMDDSRVVEMAAMALFRLDKLSD